MDTESRATGRSSRLDQGTDAASVRAQRGGVSPSRSEAASSVHATRSTIQGWVAPRRRGRGSHVSVTRANYTKGQDDRQHQAPSSIAAAASDESPSHGASSESGVTRMLSLEGSSMRSVAVHRVPAKSSASSKLKAARLGWGSTVGIGRVHLPAAHDPVAIGQAVSGHRTTHAGRASVGRSVRSAHASRGSQGKPTATTSRGGARIARAQSETNLGLGLPSASRQPAESPVTAMGAKQDINGEADLS